ncbi:hypothetical protein Xmau_03818 [Xenorhabdus mauleonii]|uniref:Uncharacterized protein n=1 Tax=Xenorhabdus mauleonii TaxID=351675 RepID=A0A1I3V2H1_9GAMM|nr:hypothetical protein [Xenorhabdus mauleonii]PHM37601.1 hypothetical protein Xmau_03818 [Xenorhabdus mauleonii]SFJ89435.1 hypothetical protein SAMN05421680_11923 [Xenorhabdus mauleonii]
MSIKKRKFFNLKNMLIMLALILSYFLFVLPIVYFRLAPIYPLWMAKDVYVKPPEEKNSGVVMSGKDVRKICGLRDVDDLETNADVAVKKNGIFVLCKNDYFDTVYHVRRDLGE